MKILVVNGPNLNLLGVREPDIYGRRTYDELMAFVGEVAGDCGVEVEIRQSNHEGVIVDWIQDCRGKFDALVINAAAYTHTSVAIHDAVKAVGIRTVEVHLSEPKDREDYRRFSFIESVAEKTCSGRGFESYADAIRHLAGRSGQGGGRIDGAIGSAEPGVSYRRFRLLSTCKTRTEESIIRKQ